MFEDFKSKNAFFSLIEAFAFKISSFKNIIKLLFFLRKIINYY